jgi:tetratricopeptide (TPR) repeat protein
MTNIFRRCIALALSLALIAGPASPTFAKSSTKASSKKSASSKKKSGKSSSTRARSGSKAKKSTSRNRRSSSRSYSRARVTAPVRAAEETPIATEQGLDPNEAGAPEPEPVLVDTMKQARDAMARGDPAEALARYLRVLARDPGDLEGLTGAGNAALAVGDADAAINFYVRAEKLSPRDGRIKAGLGSALVQKEQARPALKMFDDAVDLGVPPAYVALDRGLAYDLRGDNRKAQAEYLLALRSGPNDEATRRLALSLAMAGDRAGALSMLDPLLRKQDIPAWRTRAFVLAMTGDRLGAEQAAYAVLPRPQADAIKPFLDRLPDLKGSEKAAAVHFGHFPEDKVPQMAIANPAPSSKGTPVTPPAPMVTAPIIGTRYSLSQAGPEPRPSTAKAGTTSVVTAPIAPVATTDASTATASSTLATSTLTPAQRSLSDDRKLADRKAAVEKAAADKKLADKKAADKKLAEKAERDRDDAKSTAKLKASEPGRYWVQIASGAYKPDLDKEWAKQKAKFGKQLAGRTPWTMPYKATNRLMVGPFPTKDAAQDYVNDVGKTGLSSFPVTTTPGQKVERLD